MGGGSVVKDSPESTVGGNKARPVRQAKKKAAKRARDEFVSHVIRVRSWQFYYSRRSSDPKSRWECRPVSEVATLTLIGDIVRPEKSKYREGRLTFSGREDSFPQHSTGSLLPIGSATARSQEIEAYVFVPEDRLRLLVTAAQSGRIEVAQFRGPKLRYGSGVIHNVSLGTHFDEEEW